MAASIARTAAADGSRPLKLKRVSLEGVRILAAALRGKPGFFRLNFDESEHAAKALVHIAELLQSTDTLQTLVLSHYVLLLFTKHLLGELWHRP